MAEVTMRLSDYKYMEKKLNKLEKKFEEEVEKEVESRVDDAHWFNKIPVWMIVAVLSIFIGIIIGGGNCY